jgi:FMN phosphatase YigB (HAD superfamily)
LNLIVIAMAMPSWVLFDLNGTLLDPRPVASDAVGERKQ